MLSNKITGEDMANKKSPCSGDRVALFSFRSMPGDATGLPFACSAMEKICGLPAGSLLEDCVSALEIIYFEDRGRVHSAAVSSMHDLAPFACEWRVCHADGSMQWIECRSDAQQEADGGVHWHGYLRDVSGTKQQEMQLEADLHLFQRMDQVNRIIQGAAELDAMLSGVLELLLGMLGCDRAWLVYPCDPSAESWQVPMECTRPAYPPGLPPKTDFPMTPSSAIILNVWRNSPSPVGFGPGSEHAVSNELTENFQVKAMLGTAIYPKVGLPWAFGLHQCTHERIWSEQDRRLFEMVSRRLTDGLTSLLVARDLQVSEERFRQAFEYAGIGIVILSLDEIWVRTNRRIQTILGYTKEDFFDRSSRTLVHPDNLETDRINQQHLKDGSLPFTVQEQRLCHHDGYYVWTRVTTSLVRADDGQPLYYVMQIEDIEQSRRDEQRLKLLNFALNTVKEGAYLIDAEGRFQYVNDESCRALGYERHKLLEMSVPEISEDLSIEQWYRHWSELKVQGSIIFESSHRCRDGSVFPVEISANYFEYAGASYNLALVRDISARKQQEDRIHYLAFHNTLTGLPNRSLVMSRLERDSIRTKRKSRLLAVLIVDLDRFKIINDTLGHARGDQLLRQVAVRLSESLREVDTLGHLGGNVFAIILPELDSPRDAGSITERILASFKHPFEVGGQHLHVSASVGISLCPRDSSKADSLLKFAETALHQSKAQGEGPYRFFSHEMDEGVRRRMHMENDLRQAVERNELRLLYQPKVRLDNGRLTGVEALVRWQHPELGLVAPFHFIPVAEEIGAIIAIGEWVLRTACAQGRAWEDAGIKGLTISVNLSPRQLEHPKLLSSIREILSDTDWDPRQLDLEITESGAMANPGAAIMKLTELHEMGVQLSLDDFGTGHSSLAYLRQMPLDRLKIDRSFVSGVPEDPDDAAIVQTIIAMARQLHLKVTAEGVETIAQRTFLAAKGCDDFQGYLYGRPMPAKDIESLE